MATHVSRVERHAKVSAINLPNALTVLRLILVPVFIYLKFQDLWSAQWWALVVFCVAAGTDQLDGKIARAYGLVTDFGRVADPIADKALTLSAFVILSIQGVLPWWFTILVAIRELGITVMRAFFLKRGIVVAASQSGKIKTFLQVLAIFLLLIPWDYFLALNLANKPWASFGLMTALCVAGAALAATLWSGVAYVREGMRLARDSEETPVQDAEQEN